MSHHLTGLVEFVWMLLVAMMVTLMYCKLVLMPYYAASDILWANYKMYMYHIGQCWNYRYTCNIQFIHMIT